MTNSYICPGCDQSMVLADAKDYYNCKNCNIQYYHALPYENSSLQDSFFENGILIHKGPFDKCKKFIELRAFS